MMHAILERHAPAIIPMPTRAELDHIVGEINKTASRLHEVRKLQAEASSETRAALRAEAAALEDTIATLYERKRAWHAAHELALHIRRRRAAAANGADPRLFADAEGDAAP